MDYAPQQRHDILVDIDKEAKDYAGKKSLKMKSLFYHDETAYIAWYFTSEPGATKSITLCSCSGRYDGYVPYTKGEKPGQLLKPYLKYFTLYKQHYTSAVFFFSNCIL